MSNAASIRSQCFVAVACAFALAPSASAQSPSRWQDLHVPQGVVAGVGLQVGDKLVVYRNGTFLRVYSAVTNQWQPLALSAGTSVRLRGDILLVPESDRWTAFSAWTGTFAVLRMNWAQSTMLQDTDVATVVEGGQVHAFSAFTGQWHAHAMPAGWTVDLAPRIAVIRPANGTLAASAFNVYTGTWHDLPTQTGSTFDRVLTGAAAAYLGGLGLHAFSPQQADWVHATVTSFPAWYSVAAPEGELVALNGQLFSGVTGTFAPQPLPDTVSASLLATGLTATLNGGNGQHFIAGAATNSWTAVPARPYISTSADGVGLSYDLTQAFAFSPLHGLSTSVPAPVGAIAAENLRGNVAAILTTSPAAIHLYSALTGQWHGTPPGTAAATPFVDANAALLPTTSGLVGFAARTGAFVPLDGPGLTRRSGFAASDATALHVFDARNERWLSTPWQSAVGQGPVIAVGGHVLVATDSARAIGFGVRGSRLESASLPEPVAGILVGRDVAIVHTATHLLAFSGLPESLLWTGFPDENYQVGIGHTMRAQTVVPPGGFALVAFGPRAALPIALPPYGDLWVDPAASAVFGFAAPPGEHRATFTMTLPNSAALRGSEWLLQSLQVPAAGAPWLGDTATLRIP